MDVVNYSSRRAMAALDAHLRRPRICPGCQWCDSKIQPDDIERRMDQSKGLAGMRCDGGRIIHRGDPGFLVVP